MADRGHELTEEMLSELEARIAEEYENAAREMAKKYREYRKAWRDEDKVMRARLKAGEITQKEYTDWCYRKTMNGKQWEQLRDALAEDMVRTDQMARALAAQQMPDVFALNGNFATYQVEHGGRLDTGFTLYDRDTAMYLMRDQQLMPGPSSTLAAKIAANKDLQWNKRHIQSAVLQGIMQGESPLKVAARLAGVAQMDYNAAVRYARTMTTDAQNAGRYEGYRRAKKIGVDLKIEWSATLDGRTRHEHRMLDGQRRDVDEPFIVDGVKIMWPAQSSGPGSSDIPQEMIWNCRCTLNAWVKGFEPGQVTSSPKMGGMSYDEWKHAKEPKQKPAKVNSQLTTQKKSPFTLAAGKQYSVSDLTVSAVDDFKFNDGTSYGVRKTGKATVYTTPDGVEFVFQKPYNKKHQTMTAEQLLKAYNKVPEEIRSRGQRQIIMNDVYNPRDSYWRKTYKNFTQSYMTGGDKINVWRWDYAHDDDYLVQALTHEMAHFIDWQGTYPKGPRFANGAEWAKAMADDLAASGMKSPTKYGENAATEDFAESFAQLVVNGDDFKKRFPNRYAIIEKLLSP